MTDQTLDFTEKRKFARIAKKCVVHVAGRGLQEEELPQICGIVHDLSADGLSFLTNKDYRPGEMLKLDIDIRKVCPIVAEAKVIRTETIEPGFHLVAVVFTDMDEESRGEFGRSLLGTA